MTDENITRSKASTRKLIYVLLICALIVPLFWLSQPATQSSKDVKGQRGGMLAAYREANHLTQTDLGQIDPTSETIRLGTLGMRGVAGALLWLEAQEYQKKKDWTNLRSTLDQISKLQPHSLNVWRFQAWNISYNISVAFDDYHDKYYWVIEGIRFMLRGVTLNPQEPRLAWDMGWFVAHKIGKADEAKQFRRLFRNDDEFQQIALPPEGGPANLDLRDNWHVGKAWFLSAENHINDRHPVRGMADAIFYSNVPLCQSYYADNLEKDGRFDEAALFAWRQAEHDWFTFGERDIPATEGLKFIQLNKREFYEDKAKKLAAQIEAMDPGTRERILKAKLARLKPEERKAWETPEDKRTDDQSTLVYKLTPELAVSDVAVAHALNVSDDKKKEALQLAREAEETEKIVKYLSRERTMVNFDFWRLRCQAEQTKDMMEARHESYLGEAARRKADLNTAIDHYEKSLKLWRVTLDRFPPLKEDVSLGGDLIDMIHRFIRCLEQMNQKLPKPFILQDIIDKHDHDSPTHR